MDLTWPVEFIPLALLADGGSHGYDLHRAISGDPVLHSIWRVGRSELYFLLRKLASRGWITPQPAEAGPGPRRTNYTISAAGLEALHRWLGQPVPNPRDLRAEFLAKVYLGRKLGAAETASLLGAQAEVLRARLDRLQSGAEQPGFVRHVHRLRLRQTEAALQWLAELGSADTAEDPSFPDARTRADTSAADASR